MGRLLLVRHGQASFGAEDYDVLSDTGWEQCRGLGAWLARRDIEPTGLVRGGMRRHRESLEAIGETLHCDLSDTVVEPGWDEFDHVGIVASWPGLTDGVPEDRRAFQRVFEQATRAWIAGEHGGHDGEVESFVDFARRVRAALRGAAEAAGSGETVLVVTSGGPIAIAAATMVDPPEEPDAAESGPELEALARRWERFNTVTVNAAVTQVVVGSTGARLLTFNEHPHLTGELLTYR